MRLVLPAACLGAALAGAPLHAQDIARLYTQSELAKAASVYSPNLRGLWEEDFLTRLTPAERQRAGNVTLLLPLVGANGTLEFYSYAPGRQVFLPIVSVKFLDDISIAIAYYEFRECGMGAVSDYVGVLSERPAENLASPREALGVPANALSHAFVDDVSQKLLKSTIYFIAGHEYAHVMYGHAGYKAITAQQAQRQEMEADAFALEVMRRIAVPPLSMAHFFTLLSRIEASPADFETPQQYETYLRQRASHPVSAQRILGVADALQSNAASYSRTQKSPKDWEKRVLLLADQLRLIAQTLDNRQMRRFLTLRSRTIPSASLRAACPS